MWWASWSCKSDGRVVEPLNTSYPIPPPTDSISYIFATSIFTELSEKCCMSSLFSSPQNAAYFVIKHSCLHEVAASSPGAKGLNRLQPATVVSGSLLREKAIHNARFQCMCWLDWWFQIVTPCCELDYISNEVPYYLSALISLGM